LSHSWLESVTKEKPEAAKEVELWRMTKDTRQRRWVVRYMPSGLDLRLMLGDEFRTTELHKEALLERGWIQRDSAAGAL
jgi:hypothetical protein